MDPMGQLALDITEGWRVAGLGLARVFLVLLGFAVLIKVMVLLLPERGEEGK